MMLKQHNYLAGSFQLTFNISQTYGIGWKGYLYLEQNILNIFRNTGVIFLLYL